MNLPLPVSIGLSPEEYGRLIGLANNARLHPDAYVHKLVVEHLAALGTVDGAAAEREAIAAWMDRHAEEHENAAKYPWGDKRHSEWANGYRQDAARIRSGVHITEMKAAAEAPANG